MTLQRVRSTSYSVCSAFDQSWAPPTPWCARHIPTSTRYKCQPHAQPRLSPFCKPAKAYLEARAVEAHVPIGQIINERDQTRHDRVQAVRYIVPARETREKGASGAGLGNTLRFVLATHPSSRRSQTGRATASTQAPIGPSRCRCGSRRLGGSRSGDRFPGGFQRAGRMAMRQLVNQRQILPWC